MHRLPLDLVPLITPTKKVEKLQAVLKLVDATMFAYGDFVLYGVQRYSEWFECFIVDTGRTRTDYSKLWLEENSEQLEGTIDTIPLTSTTRAKIVSHLVECLKEVGQCRVERVPARFAHYFLPAEWICIILVCDVPDLSSRRSTFCDIL